MELTDREWKLKQEIEDLKMKIKKQNIEIADLKSEKKTLQSKLKIAIDYAEDLKKENKIKENEKLKLDNLSLQEEVKALKEKLMQSNNIVENLKVRINKDSTNSSKPSSTDNIYKKKVHINSNRKKGGKNGGQYGHKGTTLSEEYVRSLIKEGKVKHIVKDCGDVTNKNYKSKFICDIEITPVIIEYRYHSDENKSYNIPKEMLPAVQYGSYSKAIMIYSTNELMCPINKTTEFMQNITNNIFKYSEGTVVNTNKVIDKLLKPVVEEIKNKLIEVKVLHVDETGVRVNGELEWLHVYCSKDLVYYEPHEKRGGEAIDDIGILEFFVNILVHDHWKSYYKKGEHMTHAECNAHILRYLKSVLEIIKLDSVEKLIKLFVRMNNDKKKAIDEQKESFSKEEIGLYEKEYDSLLSLWGNDLNKRISDVKNSKVYDDEKNLHDRLYEYKENHLLFINDFDVPFDNNRAERALRMIKSKQKVSGGFRTENGASIFANIRSFMMTSKFRDENILNNLVILFSKREYKLS